MPPSAFAAFFTDHFLLRRRHAFRRRRISVSALADLPPAFVAFHCFAMPLMPLIADATMRASCRRQPPADITPPDYAAEAPPP